MKNKKWIKWLVPGIFVLLAVFFYTFLIGYSFSGLICLFIAGIISVYYLLSSLKKKHPVLAVRIRNVVSMILCCGIIVAGVTGYVIVFAAHGVPETDCEYILVLGCRVREDGPSVPLQERIQCAYDYLIAHPSTVCVVSGGKGADEPISEAQCMFEHLVDMGIAPERILLEEKATCTMENITFSLQLLEEKTDVRPESVGLVSSDYHLYRAQSMAKSCGVKTVGIPAKTDIVSLRINNGLREIAGVWHYIILGG